MQLVWEFLVKEELCEKVVEVRRVSGYDGWHGIGLRHLEGRMLLQFYLGKELCVSNTWLRREEKRKVTYRMGKNVTEIDLVLINKEHRQSIQNVKAIAGEF